MTLSRVPWASEIANLGAVSTRGRNATSARCLRELQLPAALGVSGPSEANGEVQRPLGLVVCTGTLRGRKNSFPGPESVGLGPLCLPRSPW